MTVALGDTTKKRDMVDYVFNLSTCVMLAYSFYETLFVVDGSAGILLLQVLAFGL